MASRIRAGKRKRNRLILVLLVSVVTAGGGGLWVGLERHRTAEEGAQDMELNSTILQTELDKQADRIINEMWKTEALERIPRAP